MAALVRLPTSSGPFTRHTAAIDAERIAAIQHYISTLWSPFDCPAQFLPHLAWALSVDVWDEAWSENRQRQVIAAAPEIHRLKGTDYAVETALNAFDLTYDDVEWWEEVPIAQRGTFKIDVLHGDVADFLNDDLREQIRLSLKAAKPKSRSFSIRHYMVESGLAYAGALISSTIEATLEAVMPQPVIEPAPGWVGTFITSEINVELT